LSYPITCPVAKGKPSKEYPYHWSVNRWIDGETLTKKNLDQNQLAIDLASFLIELQTTNPTNGPVPGKHNFYRGGNLSVYNDETINALDKLETAVIREKCIQIWNQALNTSWKESHYGFTEIWRQVISSYKIIICLASLTLVVWE